MRESNDAETDDTTVQQTVEYEQLAASTSAAFGRLVVQAGQQAGYHGWRERGRVVHRAAHHLATRGDGADLDMPGKLSPQVQALWDAVSRMWDDELTVAERLELYVHGLWINPYAATLSEVLGACRLAGSSFLQPDDELPRLESGRVRALPGGRWVAEIGAEAAPVVVGEYDSIGAACDAAHGAIADRRERLREVMAAGPAPLRLLAQMQWQSPSITGWEAVQPPDGADQQDLVSIEEIARRAAVLRKTVDVWIARHRDFPAGLGGTTARSWTAVEQWLHATGRTASPVAGQGAASTIVATLGP